MANARRVFFSFHFERDIWRVGQIRNSWLTKPDRESAGYWDAASWEEVKKKGDDAIKRWINSSLDNTSVTAVLIGAETSDRQWVRYEVQQSYKKGNGMLGIYIHNIRDRNGMKDIAGSNRFGELDKDVYGNNIYFWQLYPTYDWVTSNGYQNLGLWIEEAARKAGR